MPVSLLQAAKRAFVSFILILIILTLIIVVSIIIIIIMGRDRPFLSRYSRV